jgi:hypothetical protein
MQAAEKGDVGLFELTAQDLAVVVAVISDLDLNRDFPTLSDVADIGCTLHLNLGRRIGGINEALGFILKLPQDAFTLEASKRAKRM